jgi:hypothetical protein
MDGDFKGEKKNMNIWELKESDIMYVQREAILRAASCFNIPDAGLRDNIELLNLIKQNDGGLFKALENFYTAYWNYYYFIKVLAPHGKPNGMSDSEKDKLTDYSHEKEEAKKILLERLTEAKKMRTA